MNGLARRRQSLPQRSAARGKQASVARRVARPRVVLTEHRPDLSRAALYRVEFVASRNPLWSERRTYFDPGRSEVRPAVPAMGLDQFREPFAAPLPAAWVDVPERRASSDPPAPPEALPETLWLAAAAEP